MSGRPVHPAAAPLLAACSPPEHAPGRSIASAAWTTGGPSSSVCASRGSTPFRTSSTGSRRSRDVHAAHDALEAGEETDAAYRIAGRMTPGAATAARPSSTSSTAPASSRSRPSATCWGASPSTLLTSLDVGDLIGIDGMAFKSRRGELTLLGHGLEAAGQDAEGAAGEVPRPRGRRDPLPPPRGRPARQRGDARAVHPALEGGARGPALARRARLPRGRDADPPAALRRRAGPPVHDALQRARPRLLPADRRRAVPEAPDRRRARARLRDRQGLPQRGALAEAQPRVHDARVVRGLRRLRGHRRAARGADRATWPPRSATTGRSTSRRPGGA